MQQHDGVALSHLHVSHLAGPTFALPQHAKKPFISPERIAKRQAAAAPVPERPGIARKLFFIQMLLLLLVAPLAEWVTHKPVTISNHCALGSASD